MGIEMEELPKGMSLPMLADRCMSEIKNYRSGEASSDRYCLEIFRRAMLEHDNAAWALLQDSFMGYMLSSFRRHPRRQAASHLDSPENYVAEAFRRFWLATVHNQQLEFSTLGAALRYLQMCLDGAIKDTLRAYSRPKETTLPESGIPGEPTMDDSADARGLWEIIEDILTNPRERRVAYLLFQCNLKPREIIRFCPQEFSEVQEIYRLVRNIMEHLQRESNRIRWKLDGSDM